VTVLNLIISIVFIAVNLWALKRIIDKAGLSPIWLVLPLVSVGLTVACAIVTYNQAHGGPFNLLNGIYGWPQVSALWHTDILSLGYTQIGLLWHIDLVSIGANWLLFVFFAVVPWGLDRGQVKARSESTRAPASFTTASAKPANKAPRGVTRDYSPSPAAAAASVAAPVSGSSGLASKHCVWCAEALPGSRALFHDCGPKSRPPIFCAKCGSTLTEVGDCASCGAA
jgi:hypothetical protein